jgi:hypothetical protein
MNIKTITILFFLVSAGLNAIAQDYFIKGKDTVFCQQLEFKLNAQEYLKSVKYTDEKGNASTITDRFELLDIITIYQGGIYLDKIPLKANKPDSYIRYTIRAVDGKLRVYLAEQGYVHNPNPNFSGPSGIYRFFLKMPDGTYYKINSKKNMKTYIIPYLKQCSEFNKSYKGDFSSKEDPFMEMIRLYNSLCK